MRATNPNTPGAAIRRIERECSCHMENLITLFLVVLILIFHRPLGAILGGLFALAAVVVASALLFFFLRSILFGT